MKNLVILGAGTAGTMMANHLVSKLPKNEWKITIIDQYQTHYYQPGFLFLPFDIYTAKQVKKKVKKFIPERVDYIQKKIELIVPEENRVELEGGDTLDYNVLIVATGTKIIDSLPSFENSIGRYSPSGCDLRDLKDFAAQSSLVSTCVSDKD